MASDVHKQKFMKHKEAVASFVEEATGKKVFYIEGSLNARGEFDQVVAGDGAAIRKPIFDLADGEKIVGVPNQVDVFVSGAAHWGIFYDTCNNPLMSLVQINSRIREYVGARPPLRKGGVAILVTPCDGTIDERFRPSDREMIQLFNRLGHDPARLEDYEEEYLNRQDLIANRLQTGPQVVNSSYSIAEGKASDDIVPTLVFDDGRFTYFRFPGNREVPAVFHVLGDGAETIVNTRMEGDLLVVDRVSRQLMLRAGSAVVEVWNDAFDLDGMPPTAGTTVSGVQRITKADSAVARRAAQPGDSHD